MKKLTVMLSALVMSATFSQVSLADKNHDKWINILSADSGVALASDHGMDRDIIRRIHKPKTGKSATANRIKETSTTPAINGGLDRDIIRRKY